MAACASAVGWLAAADSWATCGSVVETCGDGVDNDCDGAADEGCGCLTAPVKAPYPFSSSTELRREPLAQAKTIKVKLAAKPTQAQYPYGANMHNRWTFAAGHMASNCRIGFAAFETVPGDSLSIGWWSGSGALAAFGPSRALDTVATNSAWFATNPAAEVVWKTSAMTANFGFAANQVECYCSNPAPQPNWVELEPNTALDGALLFPKDDIYLRVIVPAHHALYVNLDRMLAPGEAAGNFDVMYTTSGNIPAPNDCGTPFGGCTTAATGDMIGVPAQTWEQTVSVRVHAKTGKGRFRLFAAMPVARREPSPYVIYETEVGVDRNVYGTNWEKPRIQDFLAQSSQQLLAATDGQFEPERAWRIDNDVWWFIPASSYDIWLSDYTDGCGDSKVAACCHNFSTPWAGYVELNRWFWRGEVKAGNLESPGTGRSIAEVLAHELGHYAFALPDEYTLPANYGPGKPAGSVRCSHSLMAGTLQVRYQYGKYPDNWNAFEFCGDGNHESRPAATTAKFNDSSAWARAKAAYPALVPPNYWGVPISNDFSQLRRMSELLASYSTFTWE
jgi:hypothetical protein